MTFMSCHRQIGMLVEMAECQPSPGLNAEQIEKLKYLQGEILRDLHQGKTITASTYNLEDFYLGLPAFTGTDGAKAVIPLLENNAAQLRQVANRYRQARGQPLCPTLAPAA